jgi:hypothetical protein
MDRSEKQLVAFLAHLSRETLAIRVHFSSIAVIHSIEKTT